MVIGGKIGGMWEDRRQGEGVSRVRFPLAEGISRKSDGLFVGSIIYSEKKGLLASRLACGHTINLLLFLSPFHFPLSFLNSLRTQRSTNRRSPFFGI